MKSSDVFFCLFCILFGESRGLSSAESPDLNPIENVWGSMKEYLRNVYKPRGLDDLKCGIRQFWRTLTPTVCTRYINHLHTVMPVVIEKQVGPSGY